MECVERHRYDGEPIPYSSELVHSPSLLLISGATHSTAPAAGDQRVWAPHLNSFSNFSPNLLLRRSSHNYCCSGTHCTTALAIFERRDATVPTSRSCLGRHYSFLWRDKLFSPPAEISLISADRVYCPCAEIENLSANQNRKSRAVCRGNPPF